MSGLSMHRANIALVLAATALAGAFNPVIGPEKARVAEMQRYAFSGALNVDRSSPAPSRTSNLAKIRDLNFFRGRGGPRRRSFTGVPCSVAQGKRNARKVRNRQRHKKQWKKAVR